jgi:peptidyl-prolyl cis-trans isomerase C
MKTKNPRTGALRPLRLLAATALTLCLASGALAQTGESVVAKIGDKTITERDLAMATADLGEQFAQVPEEQRKAAILNALIDVKLLALKGEAAGLEKNESFIARMNFLRERALHNQYFQDNALNKVTDEEVKARYDKEIAAMPVEQEVRAMHILVKTKEEAEAIIKELEAGKDFAALAKEKSTDPSAASNGGDLGFFGKGQMVPEFEAAALALKVGEYTKTPVQTQFGFHVIRKEEERPVAPPPFADVESQVRQMVVREKYAKLVEDARKEVTIEVTDPNLKKQIEDIQKPQ